MAALHSRAFGLAGVARFDSATVRFSLPPVVSHENSIPTVQCSQDYCLSLLSYAQSRDSFDIRDRSFEIRFAARSAYLMRLACGTASCRLSLRLCRLHFFTTALGNLCASHLPQHPPRDHMSHLADQLKEKGNSAFKDGDYKLADDLYTQAIQKYSRNHLIFTNRESS